MGTTAVIQFFLFFVFLTALTLISSKSNYGGRVLRLAEEKLQGMSGKKDQVTLRVG